MENNIYQLIYLSLEQRSKTYDSGSGVYVIYWQSAKLAIHPANNILFITI
jgi:hypothetical protein